MPISTRNNRILTKNGKIVNRYIKTLTFQVAGSYFPQSYYNFNSDTNVINGNEIIRFVGNEENSVTVNYGDGESVTKEFQSVSGRYEVGYNLANESPNHIIPQHQFQDGETGLRNITFEFAKPIQVEDVIFTFVQLRGNLPVELTLFRGIKNIAIRFASYIENIPNSFPQYLKEYRINNSLSSKLNRIPDSFFETVLETVDLSGSYNLGDHLASNFYKISQLSPTIKNFFTTGCNIIELPDEFFDCVLLQDVRTENNAYTKLDERINNLINLTRLHLGNRNATVLDDFSIPNFNNLNNLNNLYIDFRSVTAPLNYFQIPLNWVGLKSLNGLNFFNHFINTSQKLNAFIPYFYQLITENAFVNPTSAEALADDYPNQFRNIAWGHGSLAVDSPVEAHPDYVSGQFFGAAQTNGQRVYELIDNYGHVVDHA